ncbi:MAG: hypothetical protein NWR42_04610, partial [Desulfobacterales bacterium]|nr:hypothetical protein [Desulfobacterales bacterium]
MILVDANILLYAVDSLSSLHQQAREWWDEGEERGGGRERSGRGAGLKDRDKNRENDRERVRE